MGHDAGGWEGHVDARRRLRHRAAFNGGMGLCVCVQLGLVVVLWVMEFFLYISIVGCFLYYILFIFLFVGSCFVWLRWWTCRFHWVMCASGLTMCVICLGIF